VYVCVCRVTKGAALESRVGQVVAEKEEVGWVGSMVEEAGEELGQARSSGQRRVCQDLYFCTSKARKLSTLGVSICTFILVQQVH
jgi:hypothetical protein